jgi:UDP:flavonoid glycosyltransferase YjiC (YdhE family)
MQAMMRGGPMKASEDLYKETLKKIGCTSVPDSMLDSWLDSYDTTLQMCLPSLEYPRSDLAPSIRYAGGLPKREIDPQFPYPSWWPEIKANAELPIGSPERKKVIPVTQGTVNLDYAQLVIPTIKAFAKRTDIIVIAILGAKGSSLPADFEVPANTRVVDFLPYDAALELAEVFITNGGYGSLMHGVLNGVPMVLCGETEDKMEVCARGEYAGLAINLRTQTPGAEQIYEAVAKISADPRYKAKALRLMQENEDMDSLSIIERQIMKYAWAV